MDVTCLVHPVRAVQTDVPNGQAIQGSFRPSRQEGGTCGSGGLLAATFGRRSTWLHKARSLSSRHHTIEVVDGTEAITSEVQGVCSVAKAVITDVECALPHVGLLQACKGNAKKTVVTLDHR
eukprot:1161832-Pelagomonas_calceolata.AAC.7